MTKRAVVTCASRPSDQRTPNQERELRASPTERGARSSGCTGITAISGAKGRDGRPEFDPLCRDAHSASSTW